MAEISRNMHKEEKRYLMPIAQINADLVDADVNDGYFMFFNQARRIQEVQGNGSPNNGFLVVGVDDNNTFMIKGGGGTNDTAGKMFNKGLSARLTGDIMYLGGSPTNPTLGGLKSFNPSTINALFLEDQFSIYPKVTSFSFDSGGNQTVIVDASANYTSDELVGRSIQVGLAGTLSTFAIVSNTATQIRLNGNQTGFFTLDDFYRITLTTPTANRNDGVYLNYWLKEISAAEDNELYHVLDVGVLEGQRRYKLIQTIHVVENDSNLFTDYQDSGAVYHYIFKIAEIHRLLGNPQITDSMVVDLRPRLKPNDQIGFPTLLQARAVVDDAGGPTNYVTVEPGWYADSINLVFVALGNRTTSPIFDPITTIGNVRYDLLSLDRNGTLVITQGNEIALPGNPYTTQFIPDMCSIAVIRITEDANVQISHDDITDYRDILLSLSSNSIDHQNTTNKQGDSPYYHISQDKYNALVDHGGFAIGATNHVANVDWVNSLLTGGQAVPTGGFLWFAAIYPPTGYHICDNSPYFINFYEALYDVIGSVYGLDDETTITFDSGSHILNAAGHTLANGDILELTTTGTLPTGLAISTKYFVVDTIAGVSFRLAPVSGGVYIQFSGNGTGIHSVWTKFRVPLVDGIHVRAIDLGSGYDIGRIFGSYQPDQMPSHQHNVSIISNCDAGTSRAEVAHWIGGNNVNTNTAGSGTETRVKNISLLPLIKY